jgi:hypothetical protein
MTIHIQTPDAYVVPAGTCGRGPHSAPKGECVDGPKCAGCLGNGIRLHLDQAVPMAIVHETARAGGADDYTFRSGPIQLS